MYYVVTGAAGFIGSNIVRALNDRGESAIIAVDDLTRGEKFRNLVDCDVADFIDKREFIDAVKAGQFDGTLDAVFHLGACSDTMATDGHYVMNNNYRYSVALLDFCIDDEVPLLYASSAAVYGGGSVFCEERSFESPLNVYGYSKFLFDQVVRKRLADAGTQVAGFRYFNVYGLSEWHKGRMASVAWHFYNQYREAGRVHPFEGTGGYGNGEQCRDFVSVEDVVNVNLHFLDRPDVSGIFNVGTGRAQTFNDVACAVVNTCRDAEGSPPLTLEEMRQQDLINYVPFPDALKGKYQHFTQADMGLLRGVGYDAPFFSVEEGVARYCRALIGLQ